MSNKFDFLMSLDTWARPYWDARNALDGLANQADGVFVTDSAEGMLSVSCNGKGLRRDFAPSMAQGFVEYVSLDSHLILNLVSITPEYTMLHRSLHDDSVHFGVQLRPIEEVAPVLNTSRNNLMFFGEISGDGRMERRFKQNSTFLAVDLMLPASLPEDNRILDVEVPNIHSVLRDCVAEMENKASYFSHDGAGASLRQCAYEMLHADFEGKLRYSYLKAKANELLCLLEVRSARLSEREVAPTYRLSQSDRHNLERVRQHIENNPAGDLSVQMLSNIAGCSANRTTTLFKAQYKMTLHQYVVQTRMQRAEKLLSTTDLSINDICRAVGYSDLSGFDRAFKKTFGVQPTAIRRH